MSFRRHDSLVGRLGDRGDRGFWRVWIEDNSFERLKRNNFTDDARFDVHRRPGTGLVIEQSPLGSCKITPRKASRLLSYEAKDLRSFFAGPEVRIRIHVGQIMVLPLMRYHAIAGTHPSEHWKVTGTNLSSPAGLCDIRTLSPLALPHNAGTIEVDLCERNLVFATELIGNQRPGRVIIRATEEEKVLQIVAGQFLRVAGYEETSVAGEFRR